MSDAAVKRPPILTGACLYLGLLSAVMSVRAVVLVSTWNSENRAADVSTTLTALRDAGLSADGAETSYRTFLTVLAVLGAMGVVFAVFTARGDRASRVGMTITIGLAGLATFAGALGATFFTAMLGALAVVFTIRLWTGEIRTYFRTLAGHPPPPPRPPRVSKPASSAVPAAQPQPQPQPYGVPPGYGPPPGRGALPRPVGIAVWSTLISSAVVAGIAALTLLSLAVVGSDEYERLMRDSPLSQSVLDQSGVDYGQLYRVTMTLLGLFLALGLGGVAASLLALVRRRRGGSFLFVMAVVTLITSVLMVPVGVPWTALSIVVLVQLSKPEAKAWFRPS